MKKTIELNGIYLKHEKSECPFKNDKKCNYSKTYMKQASKSFIYDNIKRDI